MAKGERHRGMGTRRGHWCLFFCGHSSHLRAPSSGSHPHLTLPQNPSVCSMNVGVKASSCAVLGTQTVLVHSPPVLEHGLFGENSI